MNIGLQPHDIFTCKSQANQPSPSPSLQLDQFDRVSLHVIVRVDIDNRGPQTLVACKTRKHSNRDSFAGKVGDKRPATRMTASAFNARLPVKPEEMLREYVCTECAPT